MEFQLMADDVPGAVKDNWREYSKQVWELISRHAKPVAEFMEPHWAEAVGCSVRTLQRVLKDFERCNIIERKSHNGQGRGVRIKNTWLVKRRKLKQKVLWAASMADEEAYLRDHDRKRFDATPLESLSLYIRDTTKGSTGWSYMSMLVRRTLEQKLPKDKTAVVAGEVIDFITDTSPRIAHETIKKLRLWLRDGKTLADFYVDGMDLLREAVKDVREMQETERRWERKKQVMEEKKEKFEEHEPPKFKDYRTFEEYTEALDEYNEKYG